MTLYTSGCNSCMINEHMGKNTCVVAVTTECSAKFKPFNTLYKTGEAALMSAPSMHNRNVVNPSDVVHIS